MLSGFDGTFYLYISRIFINENKCVLMNINYTTSVIRNNYKKLSAVRLVTKHTALNFTRL